MKSKIIILLFVLSAVLYAEQTASIKVDTKIINPVKISPLVNGTFIELLFGFVNGPYGLWAQEIEDRGFEEIYYDVNDSSDKRVYYHWHRWANNGDTITNNEKIKIESGGYNFVGTGGVDSFNLRVGNTDGLELGIYNPIILDDEISHNFYIYVRSENAIGTAKIVLFDSLNVNRFFEKEIDISNTDWTKIEFEIPVIPNQTKMNFAITYNGTGNVYFDETSLVPVNNYYGMRKEFADMFRLYKPTMLRYPGGSFVQMDTYSWKEAIGNLEQRKSNIGHFYWQHCNYSQRIDFGIDEYMKICELFDIEPYFVLYINRPNSIEESAELVEYLNCDTNTVWGKERAKNGHPEPYNVKYFEIGNEEYFKYTIDQYAKIYTNIYNAMKLVDSSLLLIVNGNFYDDTHFDNLMNKIENKTDIWSYHPMIGMPGYAKFYDAKSEIVHNRVVNDVFDKYLKTIENKITNKNLKCKLAPNEWWHLFNDKKERWVDTNILNHTLTTAMADVLFFNNLLKHPDIIGFANRTFGLGMYTCGINDNGKKVVVPNVSMAGLAMANDHKGNYVVNNYVDCETYKYTEDVDYWTEITPYIDVTSTVSNDSLFICVVNRHPNENIKTDINIDGKDIVSVGKIHTLTSEHFYDANTINEPNKIKVVENNYDFENHFTYTFPKHSITIFSIAGDFDSIIQRPELDNFQVYPNPTDNELCISFTENKTCRAMKIFNSTGQTVYYMPFFFYSNFFRIKPNLPIGAYLLEIECSDGVYNKQIVIER